MFENHLKVEINRSRNRLIKSIYYGAPILEGSISSDDIRLIETVNVQEIKLNSIAIAAYIDNKKAFDFLLKYSLVINDLALPNGLTLFVIVQTAHADYFDKLLDIDSDGRYVFPSIVENINRHKSSLLIKTMEEHQFNTTDVLLRKDNEMYEFAFRFEDMLLAFQWAVTNREIDAINYLLCKNSDGEYKHRDIPRIITETSGDLLNFLVCNNQIDIMTRLLAISENGYEYEFPELIRQICFPKNDCLLKASAQNCSEIVALLLMVPKIMMTENVYDAFEAELKLNHYDVLMEFLKCDRLDLLDLKILICAILNKYDNAKSFKFYGRNAKKIVNIAHGFRKYSGGSLEALVVSLNDKYKDKLDSLCFEAFDISLINIKLSWMEQVYISLLDLKKWLEMKIKSNAGGMSILNIHNSDCKYKQLWCFITHICTDLEVSEQVKAINKSTYGHITEHNKNNSPKVSRLNKLLLSYTWVAIRNNSNGLETERNNDGDIGVFIQNLYDVIRKFAGDSRGLEGNSRYGANELQIIIADFPKHEISLIPEARIIDENSVMNEIGQCICAFIVQRPQESNLKLKQALMNDGDKQQNRKVLLEFNWEIMGLDDEMQAICNKHFGQRFYNVPVTIRGKVYLSAAEYLQENLILNKCKLVNIFEREIMAVLSQMHIPMSPIIEEIPKRPGRFSLLSGSRVNTFIFRISSVNQNSNLDSSLDSGLDSGLDSSLDSTLDSSPSSSFDKMRCVFGMSPKAKVTPI
ncbi:MAG: hypothetical protein HON32_04605 [Francisellaceae bacterium]|jgi:hypothetical protein|nr:hypothetical protein [Francisellaceae bacterium]